MKKKQLAISFMEVYITACLECFASDLLTIPKFKPWLKVFKRTGVMY